MRAGRVDEAAALAKQICAAIIRQNTAQLWAIKKGVVFMKHGVYFVQCITVTL